ncbi:hypothetical protein GCM10012275_48640 [Longimycelium tulufanense]|uniref:Uncharacterized protein n=1 Tax=Longimycelium tulufanense TaxID=907463 RepID=A0A8J3CC43_9PSEU|nr:hypothetical protein [Longimycelium tulufanense]GGM72364.1 hypothetical protein GCM10012275_48640 [Longimycelium tulufanense]
MGEQQRPEVVPLDLLDRAVLRRRAVSVALGAILVAAAFGGIIGLLAGQVAGLVTATVLGVPLLLLAVSEARRRIWLEGASVVVRAIGTRRVDLRDADFDLLLTDARGTRTVGMFVRERSKGRKATNVALAIYSGTGGRELGILPLRRLADTLAGVGDPAALLYSELLVAQLRSEARGDAAQERPLHQLASLAPGGRLAQKLTPDAVARFVTSLG